jgi:hypothetical protein
MSKKILVNNVLRDATDEELTLAEADKIQAEEEKAAYDAAVSAENSALASGNTKLLDLGLTQEEITALTGYAPSE